MVDKHLSELADIDVLTLDNGGYEWVNYTPEIDLNNFEKIHSGGSSDSYILRSISDPNIQIGRASCRERVFRAV